MDNRLLWSRAAVVKHARAQLRKPFAVRSRSASSPPQFARRRSAGISLGLTGSGPAGFLQDAPLRFLLSCPASSFPGRPARRAPLTAFVRAYHQPGDGVARYIRVRVSAADAAPTTFDRRLAAPGRSGCFVSESALFLPNVRALFLFESDSLSVLARVLELSRTGNGVALGVAFRRQSSAAAYTRFWRSAFVVSTPAHNVL